MLQKSGSKWVVNGSHVQNSIHVTRIYTSLEPAEDDAWEVVTVVETNLPLDPEAPGYSQQACDRLLSDVERDLRGGALTGRVKIKPVSLAN